MKTRRLVTVALLFLVAAGCASTRHAVGPYFRALLPGEHCLAFWPERCPSPEETARWCGPVVPSTGRSEVVVRAMTPQKETR